MVPCRFPARGMQYWFEVTKPGRLERKRGDGLQCFHRDISLPLPSGPFFASPASYFLELRAP
jgi:hypothetical protein